MGTIVIWALLTGGITGGVWVSIVLLSNHAKLRQEQHDLGMEIESRRMEVARLDARLVQMESRYAQIESAVARERKTELPPTVP